MNPSIKKLSLISEKRDKLIIGLMSGTSLDGLDIALCGVSGSGRQTGVDLKAFETIPYPENVKQRLKKITSIPSVELEEVCLMHSWLGNYHGELILETLRKWHFSPSDIDAIASHGQTIYHAPKSQHNQDKMPNATLQIVDGDHIARTTNILTISDFRQKHTAAGGEGAPLASFVDQWLYSHKTENRILLNIGGIANYAYVPARSNAHDKMRTTDTGPGNTLIDAAAQKYFAKEFDKDGAIAQKGTVNSQALVALKSDSFFSKPLPRTTGPEIFNLEWVDECLQKINIKELAPEDLVATLTRLTAETIADSIRDITNSKNPIVYISGGGIHNPVLMGWLKNLLSNYTFKDFETIGPNPDAKEAVIFAVLANEMLSGEGFMLNPNDDQNLKINFGKISFPT